MIILRREMKVRISYRMSLFMGVVSGLMGLLTYGLLGNSAVGSVTSGTYGMSLASFLVSGVAFSSIVTSGLSFYQHAGQSQVEEVMVTPTGFREYILLSSLLSILTSVGTAFLYFTAATLIFGLSYSYNMPVLIAIIGLGLIVSVAIGFIGVGFQLVYKQAAVFSWLLFSFAGVVGNMFVPVQVLPGSVQIISYFTPQYYFFTGIRVALGSDVTPTGQLLAIFSLYTLALLVLGLFVLRRSLRFLRRNGTHQWS